MTLIFLSLGWLIGIWLGQLASAGALRAALDKVVPLLAPLAALAVVAALLARDDSRLRITALAVALALLGAWRAFAGVPVAEGAALPPGQVTVYGTISDRPEPRDANLLLALDVDRIDRGRASQQVRMRALVRTERYADLAYGDAIVARGELRPVDTASGYWAEYLARQGITSTLEYPQIRLADRPEGFDPQRAIDSVRGKLDAVSASILPEPQAALLSGILVGSRSSMPSDFRDALNATSTSHIVAVSGFNVTVVAGVAQIALLRLLGRRRAILAALVLVWLYSLLTGLPPSAARAALMITLTMLGTLAGRGGDALSFLCLSGALMAGLDPWLLYDLGFQLSFLATAGLVLLEPVLRAPLGRLPAGLASSLSVTLAAQLATLPIIVSNFHYLSLVTPLTNLMIAPVLPALMGLGGLAVVLGTIALPLGQVAAPLAWLPLTYLVEVIRLTAALPAAVFETGALDPALVSISYLVLLAIALWPLPEASRARDLCLAALSRVPRWALVAALAAAFSLGGLAFSGRPDGRTHVYFLDVGQGDATLIRGAYGYNVLVDGGPSPTALTSALGRKLPFLDRGLDVVVATGYGEDRLIGLVEVAKRHRIGLVVQPAIPLGGGAARAWGEALGDRGIRVMKAVPGQRIPLGPDSRLEVAWASGPEGSAGEEPALALKLVAGGVNVLLMGDMPRGVQSELARGLGRAEVLRVPRHGAAGALDDRFLQAVAPRLAVVSVRGANREGFPAQSTLDLLRNTALLRPDRQGTIELSIGPGGYEVFTER